MNENRCLDCGTAERNSSTLLCEPCEAARDIPKRRRRAFPIQGALRALPWPLADAARTEATMRADYELESLEELRELGGWTSEELDSLVPGWREARARFERDYLPSSSIETGILWQVGYLRHLVEINPGERQVKQSSDAGEVELLALFARLFGWLPDEKMILAATDKVRASQSTEGKHGIHSWTGPGLLPWDRDRPGPDRLGILPLEPTEA